MPKVGNLVDKTYQIDPDDMGDLAKDVGRRLAQIREIMGYTQIDFGKAAGLSQSRYNAYEIGARLLTLKAALLLCQKYTLDLNYLFMGDPGNLPHKLFEELKKRKKSN